uniref:Uncharacterized protein n=1 Tax=Arundo donax TaxID=35708 RepID=A0A0A9ARJ4_ARUDO
MVGAPAAQTTAAVATRSWASRRAQRRPGAWLYGGDGGLELGLHGGSSSDPDLGCMASATAARRWA